MKSPAPELYLTHILESIELATSYIAGIDFAEFSQNQQLQDAVIRRIDIIGEAVQTVTQAQNGIAASAAAQNRTTFGRKQGCISPLPPHSRWYFAGG